MKIKKEKYDWGTMMVISKGSSVTCPLHPEHQDEVYFLKDGESTCFTIETGQRVLAIRNGEKVILGFESTMWTIDINEFNNREKKENELSDANWLVAVNIAAQHIFNHKNSDAKEYKETLEKVKALGGESISQFKIDVLEAVKSTVDSMLENDLL